MGYRYLLHLDKDFLFSDWYRLESRASSLKLRNRVDLGMGPLSYFQPQGDLSFVYF